MGARERLTKLLGEFNGIVIGTFLGIAGYVWMTGGSFTPFGLLDTTWEIGGYAVGASTSTTVTTRITEYPTGPILAGVLSGIIGAGLAVYVPLVLTAPVISDITSQLITGLVAGGVVGTLTRFFPGL